MNARPHITLIGTALLGCSAFATVASAQNGILGSNFDQSALTQKDYTNDCAVTAEDVAIAAYLQLLQVGYISNDVNNDGTINFLDTRLQIEAIIRASLLDPTGSTEITTDDIFAIINTINSPVNTTDSIQADVNLDGKVDLQDVQAVVDAESQGKEIAGDIDYYYASLILHEFIGEIADDVDAGVYSEATAQSKDDCGGEFISNNWPQPRDQHTVGTSRNYPADHESSLSHSFPPNHTALISGGWPGEAWEEEGWPANHITIISLDWSEVSHPLNEHDAKYSDMWKHIPNHVGEVSATWPTHHSLEVSRVWPAGHRFSVSNTNTFPDMESHHQDISGSYPTHSVTSSQNDIPPLPDTHDTVTSGEYPPSHGYNTSAGWGEHQLINSLAWPASHARTTSVTWPAQIRPQWPPNHDGTVSNSWGVPGPAPWPIFPEDHNYLHTLLDLFNAVP